MDLAQKTPEDLRDMTNTTTDKDQLREIAKFLEIGFSGNTGTDTLKTKILEVLKVSLETEEEEEPDVPDLSDPVVQALMSKQAEEAFQAEKTKDPNDPSQYTRAALKKMDPRRPGISEAMRRAIVRARALELVRCRVQNLDPDDAAVPAALVTAYNKYTGKVSKLIPFGEENLAGYHIPRILVNDLKTRTFNMRKEVRGRGATFGVKEYKTVQMKKFAIEELPPLNKQEIQDLARDQAARGAIDTSTAI